MIYRQRRKVSQLRSGNRQRLPSSKGGSLDTQASHAYAEEQQPPIDSHAHHDNYMPDVMTLHSLGVTVTAVDQQEMSQHAQSGFHGRASHLVNDGHSHHQGMRSRATSSWNTHEQTRFPSYRNQNTQAAYPSARYSGSSRPHSGQSRVSPQFNAMAPMAQSVFTEPQRLHKLLAHIGLGSRRMMEQLIFEGRISVNSRPAEIGQKVGPNDTVRINGQVVKFDFKIVPPRLLLYYKPEGEIVSRDDPGNRNTVFTRLPKLVGARWVSVGRLDYNTSGLLLFTTSGDLANRLMHPRFEIEREYSVRIRGALSEEQIQALTSGVMLDDGIAIFRSLVDAHPDAEYLKDGNFQLHEPCNRWYRVVLAEGRNREVRKMFEAVGVQVTRLVRIRYGDLFLPQSLRRGQWRELDTRQVSRFIEKVSHLPRSLEEEAMPPVHNEPVTGGVSSSGDYMRPREDSSMTLEQNNNGGSSNRHPLQRRRWLGMRRKFVNHQNEF